MTRKQRKMLCRICVAAVMMIVLAILHVDGWLGFALWMVPYFIIGYDILYKALTGIFSGQVFDENFLMAIATVGAIVIALMGRGEYTEAVAVMLFYQLGELFQSCAVGRSRRSIAALMDIRPDSARLECEDGERVVSPDEVPVGSVILVAPGERIAIDGIVESGESSLDTSALTGESLPRDVRVGDLVSGGCVNISGVLRIRTVKAFGDSTAARILELVENAGARKAKSEKFITRFARYYTPAVCLGALLLAVAPPLVSLTLGAAPLWQEWLYRALTFLVISCPCALVVSIPLTFFSGIGGAGRQGILIKGSAYMEALAQVDCVAMDKTGTLTEGRFSVVDTVAVGVDKEELLELAALAESRSSHPIAQSLRAAVGYEPELSRVGNIREERGRGVEARVDGKELLVGNRAMLTEHGIECPDADVTATAVYVAREGEYLGYVLIADGIKPAAADSVRAMRRAGVKRVVMLSGDKRQVALEIAGRAGIDEVHAELLPDGKVERIEELMSRGDRVAFVGDGINDAPVLARADVGIAMGGIGSDAAIEAADVVIMDDDIGKLPRAIATARRCMRIVRQNTAMTMIIKGLCLLLGALGIANMWLAIFADVGVMVLAVLNSVRAMRVKISKIY